MHIVLPDKPRNLWSESTVRGFENLARGHMREAADCWLDAEAARLAGEVGFDSLAAASRANSGAAYLLRGDPHEAERCFADAVQAWQQVVIDIATLDVPMTGASSSFHFRLAAKAPGTLIDARRERYRQLAQSALIIVQFNQGLSHDRNFAFPVVAHRAAKLKAELSESLGCASPEVRLLSLCLGAESRDAAVAIYADKLSDLIARPQTFAATLSEACARLESAVALTALIVPSMCDGKTSTASHQHSLS